MDNHTAATRSRQPKGVSVGGQFATESNGEAEGRIQAAFGLDTAPLCITEETALNGDGYDSWEDGELVRIYQHQRWQTVPEDDVLFASRAARIARSHWRAWANDRGTDSRPFGSRTAHAPIPPPRY
jgi:hypothetical protein